ncbi:hypothetical protein FRB99_005194 [Tulasnella sp. 403]|nr:hypothetical protein FRB99_005194 [Tulasnella sp. 403]
MAPSTPFHVAPYTDDPSLPPSIIFPNHGLQVLSTVLNLIGMSIVTWALARRTASFAFWSPSAWKELTGVLISGTGLSLSSVTCMLGIYSCIVLYAASKVLIYAFLIEKVWIVWSQRAATSHPVGLRARFNSPIWRMCMVTMVPYLVILLLMILGRIAEIREHDGVCVIGLGKIASLPLLSFDLFITFFLTALFVHPLRKSSLMSSKLRQVASRTLVSSSVALATSAVNIAILTFLHGRELGWVCLTSCAADVTINGVALFWVTAGSANVKTNPYHPQRGLQAPYDKDDKDVQPQGKVESNEKAPFQSIQRLQADPSADDLESTKGNNTLHPALPELPASLSPSIVRSEADRHSLHSQRSGHSSCPPVSRPFSSYRTPAVVLFQPASSMTQTGTTAEVAPLAERINGGRKAFIKGLTRALGIDKVSEAQPTMSVQVTVTTELQGTEPANPGHPSQ